MSDKFIPDYNDLLDLAKRIGKLTREVGLLDITIKSIEATTVKTVTNDTNYFLSGKPLSMEYIKSTWKYVGIDGKLLEFRIELVKKEAELEEAKLTFQAMRDMVTIYVTDSANMRSTHL